MCTLVILTRPEHEWPLIIAANRDEMRDRSWQAPARHWEDRPNVTAGRDEHAGGTWLGMNDEGVVAGILNRINSLGSEGGKRSRGELPLEALDHADAQTAAQALGDLDPRAYRAFNMVIADRTQAWCLVNEGNGLPIIKTRIEPGVSMVTASGLNDYASDRIAYHLPRFQAAPPPNPFEGDWFAWQALIADRSRASEARWDGAMLIDNVEGYDFGTVSSSLIAIPEYNPTITPANSPESPPTLTPKWLFAPGMPDVTPWQEILL